MTVGDYGYLRRLAIERSQNAELAVAEKDFQNAIVLCHYVERQLQEQVTKLSQAAAKREGEIAKLNQALAEREGEIAKLNQALAEREGEIAKLNQALAESKGTLFALLQSRSWKVTWPLRFIGRSLRSLMPDAARRFRLARALWAIRKSGLFDSKSYLENNPDVASFRWGPLWHYLLFGATEGRDPHPLFCTSFYLQNNRDVAQAGANPLHHYLRSGAAEGRDPHPLFDTSYYLEQYPDVAKTQLNPLVHYLRYGAYEGRDPHPNFDSNYYLEQNPDVAEEHLNPLAHYVGPGIAEGRDPNPIFDTSAYLEQNPEVALQGLNPLVHYLGHSSRTAVAFATLPEGSDGFNLRAALRNEFKESGRVLLDSEYDSHPLVSVIIPCFNQNDFLEDAVLSSLLACSYPLELIVVADGSTDSQSGLVDELTAEYKFTLVRQTNTGLAEARNAGIERARGKFVQFLDANDLLAPGKIDIQINEFRSDPQIDICISEYETCDANGMDRRMATPSTIDTFCFSREDFLWRWGNGFFVPIHCALLRRELLDAHTFQLTTEADTDDQMFWAELSSRSPKYKFNPAVLATRRICARKSQVATQIAVTDAVHRTMVSVIIPCYNQGRYLDEALQSVQKQTYRDFEIIVVDDGSTDPETIRILDEYNRPNTRLIRTSNQKLVNARNNGIRASLGKYVLPLDADDKLGSTYLEQGVRLLEADEDLGIVYCKAEFFGEASGTWELPVYHFPDILVGNQIFCSAMFRKSDWTKVNGYNSLMIYGWEDFDFWLSLIELGRKVFCIPEKLFFYRKHSDSMIAQMKREHAIYSFAQLFRNHPKLYLSNIAAVLDIHPELWQELQRLVHGVEAVKDPRLQLAQAVMEELISKTRACSALAGYDR